MTFRPEAVPPVGFKITPADRVRIYAEERLLDEHSTLRRAARIAQEYRAGFETFSQFVSWLMDNYSDDELGSRSMTDLWFLWRNIEMSR